MKIETEIMIDDVRLTQSTEEARAQIGVQGLHSIVSQHTQAFVEGSITFYQAGLKPGQRIKMTLETI